MSIAAAAFDYRQFAAALSSRDKTDVGCRSAVPSARQPQTASARCCACGAAPASSASIARDAARAASCARTSGARSIARLCVASRPRQPHESGTRPRCGAPRRSPCGIAGSRSRARPAETYLREARRISCSLPPTLGYLPPRGEYRSALIAAFVIPDEPEPGGSLSSTRRWSACTSRSSSRTAAARPMSSRRRSWSAARRARRSCSRR